nr:hypothetical protein [Tanacetum cinerariifolium]
MRNKPCIDNLDIDDLYNNLKVYEADIKGSSGSSSNLQNVAFVSVESTSSTNELNAAYSVSTATCHNEEVRTEKERQEEAYKAALAEMYDEKVNDQESVDSDKEIKKCLKVVLDDDKAIDYETLDVKSLIVNCESQVLETNKACDILVYKLTRLDGSYRHFSTFSRMLEVIDRQDVLDLHKIIMERFPANDPEVSINMFVKKRYPVTKEILEKMLSSRLEAETESTLALDLIKFSKLQIEEK